MLHDRCAAASIEFGSPGVTWSACHGSLCRGPSPQIQQNCAVSLMALARRL